MTVAGNLSFGLRTQRMSSEEISSGSTMPSRRRAFRALHDRFPNERSGGQQQRVAIALSPRVLPLLLFNEPMSNLDAALREDMRIEMMELVRNEGTTVVYVTHDRAEAMALFDRIAARGGAIAQFATPREIYEAPVDAFVASFIGASPLVSGEVKGGLFRIDDANSQQLTTTSSRVGAGLLILRPEDARPADA